MLRLFAGVLLSTLTLSAHAGGVSFSCNAAEQPGFTTQLTGYLAELGVSAEWVSLHAQDTTLTATLNPTLSDIPTVNLAQQPDLDIKDDIVQLPLLDGGKLHGVQVVSRKEIVLALLNPGRTTIAPCEIQAFRDHIGLRQNIVAWATNLEWGWPDGGAARWNKRRWRNGTPRGVLWRAVQDAFVHQDKYAVGCYTATKLVLVQAALDYYRRVRPDAARLAEVIARLEVDHDPLVSIEPKAMWAFEPDYTVEEGAATGKLTYLSRDVAPGNFVPGDWAYLLNTDTVTYQKTGYEGSNAIYLGRGLFDDYYNDHANAYTYREKVNEVYQWRHGVFSRRRDAAKAQPLSERQFKELERAPERGGLVVSYRAVPYFFGHLALYSSTQSVK